jgi:hypothetical protein
MIEVLVSLVIVCIGVLGMVALQSRGIGYANDTVQRSTAAQLASELAEMMRADPDKVRDADRPAPGHVGLLHRWQDVSQRAVGHRRAQGAGRPRYAVLLSLAVAGVDLHHLVIVQMSGRDSLWAVEQRLRSGCCHAALCWPKQADDRALRHL